MPFKTQPTSPDSSKHNEPSKIDSEYLNQWPNVSKLLLQAKTQEENEEFDDAFRIWEDIAKVGRYPSDIDISDSTEKMIATSRIGIRSGFPGYTIDDSKKMVLNHLGILRRYVITNVEMIRDGQGTLLEIWPSVVILLQDAKGCERLIDFHNVLDIWDIIVVLVPDISDDVQLAKGYATSGARGDEDLAVEILDRLRKSLTTRAFKQAPRD
jgi:hypothetical protein